MAFHDARPSFASNNIWHQSQNVHSDLDSDHGTSVVAARKVDESSDSAKLGSSGLEDHKVGSSGNEIKGSSSTPVIIQNPFAPKSIFRSQQPYEAGIFRGGERFVPIVAWIRCPLETAPSFANAIPPLTYLDTASESGAVVSSITPRSHNGIGRIKSSGNGNQPLDYEQSTATAVPESVSGPLQQLSNAAHQQSTSAETALQPNALQMTLSPLPELLGQRSPRKLPFRGSELTNQPEAQPSSFPLHRRNYDLPWSPGRFSPLTAPGWAFDARMTEQPTYVNHIWRLKDQDSMQAVVDRSVIQHTSSSKEIASAGYRQSTSAIGRMNGAQRDFHPLLPGNKIFLGASNPRSSTEWRIHRMNSMQSVLHTRTITNKIVKRKQRSSASTIEHPKSNTLDKLTVREERRNEKGELEGVLQTFGARQQTRKQMTPAARALTARSKLYGACPRCRRLKKPCRHGKSQYLPCDRCLNSSSIVKLPCKLPTVYDIVLIRYWDYGVNVPQNPLNFLHRKGIWPTGAGLKPKTSQIIEITHGMGVSMYVKVCEYIPIRRDTVAYPWTDQNGVAQQVKMPHICVADREDAKRIALAYAQKSIKRYLNAHSESCNVLTGETFDMAAKSNDKLVGDSLMLWSACRMTEKTWCLCQPEIFGLKPLVDPADPWQGKVPVTPIMDQQLDEVFQAAVLKPLQDRVRRELAARLSKHKTTKDGFLNLLLTIFILLSNLEAQNAHDRNFASRYRKKGRFWGPSFGNYPLWEKRLHSAKTMLAQFHHVCRGSAALRLAWQSSSLLYGGNQDAEAQYLTRVKYYFDRYSVSWQSLRANHRYEESLYWAGQLFVDDWLPDSGFVEILDGD